MMDRMPLEDELYEDLRQFRNSIFDGSCYYTNDTLMKLATLRPSSRDDLLRIDPSEEKFKRFGESFLALLRGPRQPVDEISGHEVKVLAQMRRLEIALYNLVSSTLMKEHEQDWWYKGIPEQIRVKAAKLHEESNGQIPREYGLMFIDLKEIVCRNWGLFQFVAQANKESKAAFETAMKRLNDIRKRLCHPLRLRIQPITQADADFLSARLALIEKVSMDFLCDADRAG